MPPAKYVGIQTKRLGGNVYAAFNLSKQTKQIDILKSLITTLVLINSHNNNLEWPHKYICRILTINCTQQKQSLVKKNRDSKVSSTCHRNGGNIFCVESEI